MARNIFRCTRRRFGRLHCAFMRVVQNQETGELEERGCILGMRDEYRMYPEHHSNGDVIHNRPYGGSDPFPFGVDVIWENDSPHDTGLTYSREGHRLRSEEYNMHPLYSIKDINEPFVSGVMADDHVGYAFGGENISISPNGWATQKILGLQRVEDCNMGIYSKYDEVEKMILPKCIRDYTGDIKGWVNYTAAPDNSRKKSFFICEESDKSISEYCIKRLGKNLTAAAIYQIMVAIKQGEYVNLREALLNHNLPVGTVNLIMNEVSTKSKNTIYSNMNLQKYWLYWKAMEKMGLSKEKLWLFRCHLLNYVLNYPAISKKDLTKIPTSSSGLYATNRRYWWVVLMVKEAFKIAKETRRKIITNKSLSWIQPFVKSLSEVPDVIDEPEDLKNPAVKTFVDIIETKKETDGWKRRKRVFARILKAGKRWSPPEVKVAWFYFVRAYDAKKAESFWQFVESVRTGTPHAVMHIIQAAGISDDVEFTAQRAFAHHLLEARQSRKTFVVDEPKLNDRWQLITPKSGFGSHADGPKVEKNEIFWMQLKRMWLVLHRQEHILQIISEHLSQLPTGKARMLAEMYQDEINEDVLIGTELSKDDIGRDGEVTIVDIDGNEDTFGGEEWRDSESLE